jgi:hypothetical protein
MIGSTIATSVEDGLDKLARHARMVLVVLAAICFGGAAFFYLAGEGPVQGQVVGGTFFAVLAFWARRSPMTPIVIGVSVYALNVIYAVFATPEILTSLWFVVMNGIVAALCFNAITTARSYEQLKAQLAPAKP